LPSRWGVTIHDCKSSPCLLAEVLDSDSIADTIPSSTGLRASTETSVIGLCVFFFWKCGMWKGVIMYGVRGALDMEAALRIYG